MLAKRHFSILSGDESGIEMDSDLSTNYGLFEEHSPILKNIFLVSAHLPEVFAVGHIFRSGFCDFLWGEMKTLRNRYRYMNSDGLMDLLYGKN